ncbi:MAG: SMP-30/gluconolactonase/LRE family protein [Steroidobacteraceae bacterium]|nr:SMP-30/gluconolactonase/LRE family protein [Steroidobacteraceae bacterium]
MRNRLCLAALLFSGFAVTTLPAHAACEPEGDAQFICGLPAPEDLIRVPDSPWVIVSGMAEKTSQLYLVDSRTKEARGLYPAAGARTRHDKKLYGACPGPLPKGVFGAHGIDLQPRNRGAYTLYAVNHAGRESIEVLELDVTGAVPVATWIGCVVFPAGASGNGIVGLPDGGFITTNFKDPADKNAFQKMSAGEITGNVLEWHPGTGWTELPDSAMSGANGIALSRDGKWLYVAGWPGKNIVRFERTGERWTKRDAIPTGFLTDNLRWMADGSLLAAGQDADMPAVFGCAPPACRVKSAAVKIDPRTLEMTRVIAYPGSAHFEGATTAIDVGDEYWVGSFRGDRVVRLPAR